MELRHLRYFLAVAEEEHFGRAAERLRVAQPALSRRIADLEAELRVELFTRRGRGVSLSEAGRVFRDDVQELLKQTRLAVERAKRTAAGQVGELTLGFVESAAWNGPMPLSFSAFRERHPLIVLQLLPMNSLEQLRAIRESQLDAGFLYDRPSDDPSLTGELISTENLALAVPRRHPLAQLQEVSLRALSEVPIVTLARKVAPRFMDRLHFTCREKGIALDIVQEAQNDSSLLSFVAAGMGAGFVITTTRWRKPETVALLPIVDLDMPVRLEFVWRRHDCPAALGTFLETLRTGNFLPK